MKISFRESGGFAGLIRGCEIDTKQLSNQEAAQLESLVTHSGIFQHQGKATPNARDVFNYEVVVETDKETHRASFNDMNLPESAIPLLEYLQARAEPMPVR